MRNDFFVAQNYPLPIDFMSSAVVLHSIDLFIVGSSRSGPNKKIFFKKNSSRPRVQSLRIVFILDVSTTYKSKLTMQLIFLRKMSSDNESLPPYTGQFELHLSL